MLKCSSQAPCSPQSNAADYPLKSYQLPHTQFRELVSSQPSLKNYVFSAYTLVMTQCLTLVKKKIQDSILKKVSGLFWLAFFYLIIQWQKASEPFQLVSHSVSSVSSDMTVWPFVSKVLVYEGQVCRKWVGRVGNCPPSFWQNHRKFPQFCHFLGLLFTVSPPRLLLLPTPLKAAQVSAAFLAFCAPHSLKMQRFFHAKHHYGNW